MDRETDRSSLRRVLAVEIAIAVLAGLALPAMAIDKNYPWGRKTRFEPDSQVPGSFVNLGQTGARAKLAAKSLEVKYIFPGTAADGKLKVGDVIVGAGGKAFEVEHMKGYSPPSGGYGE